MGMATTLALFDVDGTLLLTHDDLYVRLMIKTLSEVSGTTLPLNAMSKVEHKARPVIATAADILEAHGAGPINMGAWCRLLGTRYRAAFPSAGTSHWEGAPGAAHGLGRLRDAGIRLALLTGTPESVARLRMERLGLAEFFAGERGGYGCDSTSRVDLIRTACERAGVETSDAVEIGDTAADASSALEAGARSIRFRSMSQVCDELLGPDVQPA